ncbi:MAG: hypothetical protein AB1757_15135 [Acidobacteriota bacterium]
MNCAYHTQIATQVQCSNCNRGLCTSCDHRIKGFPYCQDCIVAGISLLQNNYRQSGNYQTYYQSKSGSTGKAILASIFAFFPSGGAIYNRQNVKAIVQFISIFGFFYLGKISGFFGLVGFALYLQSIFDSFRTAKFVAEGGNPAESEERYKQALIKKAPAIGVGLIVVGLFIFIRLINPFTAFLSFSKLAPVALIFLGGYLLTRYFKQSREYSGDATERKNLYLVSNSYSEQDQFNQNTRTGNYR